MNIACIVITFNPDISSLLFNIATYIDGVNKLYIVNNSSNSLAANFQDYNHKVTIIENHENKGIAKALNIGCQQAIKDGFDYVLTMDQDSYFSPLMANAFFETAEKLFSTIQDLAIVLPQFQEKAINDQEISEKFIYKNNVITSGNILKLSAYNKILEGFDDNLFIDGVDLDFCFKLRLLNFTIAELTTIYLQHQIGETLIKKQLFGSNDKNYIIHLHNPIRQYYSTRNNLYLVKKYRKNFPKETRHIFFSLLHKIKNNLRYNKKKIKGLKMTMKGFYHFLIGRYGKY